MHPALYAEVQELRKRYPYMGLTSALYLARERMLDAAQDRLSPLTVSEVKDNNDYVFHVHDKQGREVYVRCAWDQSDQSAVEDWEAEFADEDRREYGATGNSRGFVFENRVYFPKKGDSFDSLRQYFCKYQQLSKQCAFERASESWSNRISYTRSLLAGDEQDGSWRVIFYNTEGDFLAHEGDWQDGSLDSDYNGDMTPELKRMVREHLRKRL